VPNFTYAEFTERIKCRPYIPSASQIVVSAKNGQWLIHEILNPTLVLTRGQTYTFNITIIGYRFWIQSVPGDFDESALYNSGITNNGALNTGIPSELETMVFIVPLDSPDTLYYVTNSMPYMRGIIQIV
jgi:hypothetical protein